MDADVAGFNHEYKRGCREQPQRRGDGVHVHDLGHRRLLMQVVVQIKAESDAHIDPEDGKPDECGAAIVARRPGCGCVKVHPRCPPSWGEDGERSFGEKNLFLHLEPAEIIFLCRRRSFCRA